MTQPGPKPMPSNVRAIRGNPGKRSEPASEPKGRSVKLRAPKGLNQRQQKIWRAMAQQFHTLHLTTEIDVHALRLLIDCYERYLQANEAVMKHGLVVKGHGGIAMQSPYLPIANKAHEQLVRMLNEFGMTPSSRTRVQSAEDGMNTTDDDGQLGLLD